MAYDLNADFCPLIEVVGHHGVASVAGVVDAFAQSIYDLGVGNGRLYRAHIFVGRGKIVVGRIGGIGAKERKDAMYVYVFVSAEREFRVVQTDERHTHLRKIVGRVRVRLVKDAKAAYRTVVDAVERFDPVAYDRTAVDRERRGGVVGMRTGSRNAPCEKRRVAVDICRKRDSAARMIRICIPTVKDGVGDCGYVRTVDLAVLCGHGAVKLAVDIKPSRSVISLNGKDHRSGCRAAQQNCQNDHCRSQCGYCLFCRVVHGFSSL